MPVALRNVLKWRNGHDAATQAARQRSAPHVNASWVFVCVMVTVLAAHLWVGLSIPRLQSPDEPDHVRRAYLVAHGEFLLSAPENQMSGGWVDSEFDAYLAAYHALSLPQHPGERVSQEWVNEQAAREWSGQRTRYAILPGTGFYFPLIYAPQALGILVGELTGQTIEASYRLAQFAALLTSLVLVFVAFRLWAMPPAAGALLLMPMSVFQVVSASIDGVANGLLLVVVTTFLSAWQNPRQRHHAAMLGVLCVGIFVVVTCRYQLAGLLLLPFALAWRRRSWACAALGLTVLAATLAWVGFAMATIVDNRVDIGADTATILAYYVTAPLEFAKVFYRSWADPELRALYYESFFGRLAATDVRYTDLQYRLMAALVLLITALSIERAQWRANWQARAVLAVCAVAAVPLTFLAMVLAWTPHPAFVVYGVQGRYFIGPALLLIYALSRHDRGLRSRRVALAWVLVLVVGVFSVVTIPQLMAERFYGG